MKSASWPVRLRLSLLYGGAFLSAGVLLVALMYWLVARSLRHTSEYRPDLQDVHDSNAAEINVESLDGAHEAVEAYRADALSSLLLWSLIGLAGALVLAVVLGWVLAGRALRPLRQVTETANRVADQSLHERIALAGPNDEVKELADTIDAMLERLDRSFDAQRRFVANASHELRTPLAVNRTLLEVAVGDPDVSDDLQRLAPQLLATHERSERLIEGLLTLARSEHEVTERTPLDLADLAAVAVQQGQGEAQEREVTVTTDLLPAPVAGSPVLVERLTANLVQNAVQHSPPAAEITIRTYSDDGESVLQVENPGAALHQHEIDGLFEPFTTGNGRVSDGNGVGLGLSIVRSVAQAHSGRVTAHPREGGGLVVRVELPRRLG